MRLPTDFRTAQEAGTGTQRIPVGGYICKIINAKVEEYNGSEKLILALDVAEGEHQGFYKKVYVAKKASNPDATWPCKYGQFVANKEGNTSPYFKGLINSIEKSNSGYDFANTNGNEKTLIGKFVGAIFAEEEFKGNNGKIYTTVKPVQFRSVETIRKGEYEVPPKKTLESSGGTNPFSGFTEVATDDDELPFC